MLKALICEGYRYPSAEEASGNAVGFRKKRGPKTMPTGLNTPHWCEHDRGFDISNVTTPRLPLGYLYDVQDLLVAKSVLKGYV